MNKKMNELKQEYNVLKDKYMEKEMSPQQVEAMKAAMEKAKADQAKISKIVVYRRCMAAAAGFVMAFIILPNTSGNIAYAMSKIPVLGNLVEVVTFRDYQYEDDRNTADVNVPELAMVPQEDPTEQLVTKDLAGEALMEEESAQAKKETLQKSMEEINAEIQAITEPFIEEFKQNLENEQGYQDVIIESEVVNTTDEYFTLKLICYTAEASGAEWNYYYTIDLATGERLQLKDLFAEGADYVTPISENIISQMRKNMEEDEMNMYWLDDEIEELNFKAIKEDQSFYMDAAGNIVISFNEGDVAPMYMGVVEFVIPEGVVQGILR